MNDGAFAIGNVDQLTSFLGVHSRLGIRNPCKRTYMSQIPAEPIAIEALATLLDLPLADLIEEVTQMSLNEMIISAGNRCIVVNRDGGYLTDFLAKVNCQVTQCTKSGCDGEFLVTTLLQWNKFIPTAVEISKLNGVVYACTGGELEPLEPKLHSNVAMGYSGLSYLITGDAMFTKDHGLTVKLWTVCQFRFCRSFHWVIHAGREGTLADISLIMANRLKALDIKNVSIWFGPASCVLLSN